jgi:hypothetical protein
MFKIERVPVDEQVALAATGAFIRKQTKEQSGFMNMVIGTHMIEFY